MKKPTKKAIEKALELASRIFILHEVYLVKVPVASLEPREDAYLSHDVTPLAKLWKKSPQNVPPIVVSAVNYSRGRMYRIIDGHHRYAAAMQAGLKDVYVLEDRDP